MAASHSIAEKLNQSKPVLSVEFYPPRSEEEARRIIKSAQALQEHHLDYVSITYGAGGSTRKLTIDYGEILHDLFDFEVMPHLTCVGHSQDELKEIIEGFQQSGFHNIMTLRGDPPKGEDHFTPHPEGFRYASELVNFIKQQCPDFCLGVGGYPEMHPEAASVEEDLQHLKHKVDQGASFITTQLFFRNEDYFSFVEQCRALGITVPIIPGILPALSFKQVQRFCSFCHATVPQELLQQLEATQGDNEKSIQAGIDWAYKQIQGLLEFGAPGIHLYILNRSESAAAILRQLREDKLVAKA